MIKRKYFVCEDFKHTVCDCRNIKSKREGKSILILLWQPLITKTNDHTSSKSLKLDIKWEAYKRTRQGVSAKLESYIYRVHMVHATFSYLSHFLLKATMLYICALMSSSRSFYYVLGLWCHIMWHVMWLQCHMPSSLFKRKEKEKKISIKSEK